MEETGYDLSRAAPERRLWARPAGVGGSRCSAGSGSTSRPRKLTARIRDHIASGAEDEIEDVVVVRRPGDAGPTVTPYMQAMIEFHFDTPDVDSGWQTGGIGIGCG